MHVTPNKSLERTPRRVERAQVVEIQRAISSHISYRAKQVNGRGFERYRSRLPMELGSPNAAGIAHSTISAIERDRINLGVERAKQLARALRCHPAVLVFPGWDVEQGSAA